MTNLDLDHDDERFESYLRQFQPLAPDALPSISVRMRPRRWRLMAAWSVAAAAMIAIVVGLLISKHPLRDGQMVHQVSTGEERGPRQILTVASAAVLLTDSPSAQAALDQATFHPQLVEPPKGKQSALAVLSKATERL